MSPAGPLQCCIQNLRTKNSDENSPRYRLTDGIHFGFVDSTDFENIVQLIVQGQTEKQYTRTVSSDCFVDYLASFLYTSELPNPFCF